MIFTGEYKPNIDNNGRLAIPSRLREGLDEGLFITNWSDDCLAIFPSSAFESISNKINALPQDLTSRFRRNLFSSTVTADIDKQGRLIIPLQLRDVLETQQGEVTVVGNMDRIEIWDNDKWADEKAKWNADTFKQDLRELGI